MKSPLRAHHTLLKRAYSHRTESIKYRGDLLAIPPDVSTIPTGRIRNFGIIAHIDHGKSTLADRLLELTGCIKGRGANNCPTLDSLPVERERGITVKAQSAAMFHVDRRGCENTASRNRLYMLNLIDTPGHVDFSHEVARSLAAMQGALLVVDACTGVQAQTVAHFTRAREAGISHILPVINKIDMPQANIDLCMEQLSEQLGLDVFNLPSLLISAKRGLNVEGVLDVIVDHIPPPRAGVRPDGRYSEGGFIEAMLIDSWFRDFSGVISLVSITQGTLKPGMAIKSAFTGKIFEVEEVGILQPALVNTGHLHTGQIGYIRCGIRSTKETMIGDIFYSPESAPSIQFEEPTRMRPVVFSGMFPARRDEYEGVAIAFEKLLLNDSSVTCEKTASTALGPGWRLGFLGSLHLDVFRQRLGQEFSVDVIMTTPNVSYEVHWKDPSTPMNLITNAEEYPDEKGTAKVREFREPVVNGTLMFPSHLIGAISDLCSECRGSDVDMEYISSSSTGDRVKMTLRLPLNEVIGSFNDRLLSLSAGYASFTYEVGNPQPVDLVHIGIRLNGDLIDILGTIQPRCRSERIARQWCKKLAELLPRQQFAVAIQAVVGGKIIARESIPAMRKDVIAKCYGGDKSRKMKLLEAQKEGKERMKMFGKVQVPHEVFVSIMKLSIKD